MFERICICFLINLIFHVEIRFNRKLLKAHNMMLYQKGESFNCLSTNNCKSTAGVVKISFCVKC